MAYALEYAAPFRDDVQCVRWLRHPQPPDRRHRLKVFAAVRRLVEQGHRPQATRVAEGHLDDLRARLAWSRDNRYPIEP
ncbi:hypothetical protein ACFXDE_04370 [Kitasatospora sp. NPDC059408]|uniref:hypothetical protein n=1 Tax=Kitasatospora sp. NPDC059408 TaxID=3346823 RepID=UPI0036942F26